MLSFENSSKKIGLEYTDTQERAEYVFYGSPSPKLLHFIKINQNFVSQKFNPN